MSGKMLSRSSMAARRASWSGVMEPVGLEVLPDGLELVELVVVGFEAELGVVSGGAGGDEELPVGGFEQEELAAELLDDALAWWRVVSFHLPAVQTSRR